MIPVDLLSLLLVSVLWGCTNPFLRRGTEGIENVTKTNKVAQLLAEVKFLFLNIKVINGILVLGYYTHETTARSNHTHLISFSIWFHFS